MERKNMGTNFEATLRATLKSMGYIFPETDEEADNFLRYSKSKPLPEKFASPDFIFSDNDKTDVAYEKINTPKIKETETKWAIAARNGKELPQCILEKMKRDKENAKNK